MYVVPQVHHSPPGDFVAVQNPRPSNVTEKTSKKRKHESDKTTEGTAAEEFNTLKQRLKCHTHGSGRDNHWCYISATNAGEHVPLTVGQLSLWARKIVSRVLANLDDASSLLRGILEHDNEADYVTPPNCLDLDHLRKKSPRARASYASASASANVPPIHIHFPGRLPFSPITNSYVHGGGNHDNGGGNDSGGDTEPDSDYENDLTVAEVIKTLHADYPILNMPQYADALRLQSIIYATSVFDFDQDFYVNTVGMAPGAAKFLVRQTEKELKKRRSRARGMKRARVVPVCEGDESVVVEM